MTAATPATLDTETLLREAQACRLVQDSCLALDEGRWADFLALCDAGMRYRIVNYSPEIRKVQCWMDQDHAQLSKLFELLPKHNSDRPVMTRHVAPARIDARDPGRVRVTSKVAVYRTEWDGGDSHLDSGSTSLYVIGRYLDEIALGPDGARLLARTVDLDTRQVGIGTHYIL
jgi:methanesulfonate monooxygenase small subunit